MSNNPLMNPSMPGLTNGTTESDITETADSSCMWCGVDLPYFCRCTDSFVQSSPPKSTETLRSRSRTSASPPSTGAGCFTTQNIDPALLYSGPSQQIVAPPDLPQELDNQLGLPEEFWRRNSDEPLNLYHIHGFKTVLEAVPSGNEEMPPSNDERHHSPTQRISVVCDDFISTIGRTLTILSGGEDAVNSLSNLVQAGLRYQQVLDGEYPSAFRAMAIGLRRLGVDETIGALFHYLKGIHAHQDFENLVRHDIVSQRSSEVSIRSEEVRLQALCSCHFLSEHSLVKILRIFASRRGIALTLGVCNWPYQTGDAQYCRVDLFPVSGNAHPDRIVWMMKENMKELQSGSFNRWSALTYRTTQDCRTSPILVPAHGQQSGRGPRDYPERSTNRLSYSQVAASPPKHVQGIQRHPEQSLPTGGQLTQRRQPHPFNHGGYPCGNCGKAFDRQGELTKHWRNNIKCRPPDQAYKSFECPTCGKSFSQAKDVNRHAKQHMPPDERKNYGTRHYCPHANCDWSLGGSKNGFERKDRLTRHLGTCKKT